jgi:branched-subunit amino acid aminotransferase/4-amino-4-deoxychorismate lyase
LAFELLETLRWTPEERWYLLDRHLARLHASARYFGFPFSPQAVAEALGAAENGADEPLRVRLLLAEDGATRVERTPLNIERRRMRVRLATQPVDPDDVFLYHKTTNRAVYERARLPDCDDVILWNGLGEATESTIANLVVEIDGRRVTPPVSCGLLPGTMRAELLANGEIVEGRFSVDALRSAPIWLVNSVRGWCDADLVD